MKEKLLGYIAYNILKFLSCTWRYQFYFKSEEDKKLFYKNLEHKKPELSHRFLIGFFHQDELSIIPLLANSGIAVLVSLSKDGQIMTNVALNFGYVPVRGSSSRGAIAGFLAAFKKVKEGYKFAMAVDGPRGPIYKVKDGIPALSTKENVPVVPIRLYPQRYKLFEKSWNQAKLPMPFTKIKVMVGKISVYDASSLEQELTML